MLTLTMYSYIFSIFTYWMPECIDMTLLCAAWKTCWSACRGAENSGRSVERQTCKPWCCSGTQAWCWSSLYQCIGPKSVGLSSLPVKAFFFLRQKNRWLYSHFPLARLLLSYKWLLDVLGKAFQSNPHGSVSQRFLPPLLFQDHVP